MPAFSSPYKRHTIAVAFIIAAALSASGCAENAQQTHSIDIEETRDDLEYYYACGNEVLVIPGGSTYYPLLPDDQDSFEDSAYRTPQSSAPRGLLAVAPPGPGDDTGTLTIYTDEMARWVSDSGVEAWLTTEPQSYNWVC